MLRNKRSQRSEKPCAQLESSTRLPQLEKACVQQQRPSATKKPINFKKEYDIFIYANYFPC